MKFFMDNINTKHREQFKSSSTYFITNEYWISCLIIVVYTRIYILRALQIIFAVRQYLYLFSLEI